MWLIHYLEYEVGVSPRKSFEHLKEFNVSRSLQIFILKIRKIFLDKNRCGHFPYFFRDAQSAHRLSYVPTLEVWWWCFLCVCVCVCGGGVDILFLVWMLLSWQFLVCPVSL